MAFDEADPRDTETGTTPPPPGLDRHPAWAAAQARLRRFTLLSGSVPVPMAYYLRDGLVCGYANPSYAVTFGLDARSIVSRNLAEVVGADTPRLVQPHFDRLFAGGNTVRYSRSLTIADSMTRWFDVSLVPHGVAANGTALARDAVAAATVAVLPLVGAFVLMTDIARFHDAEQALRDSEERLRKFMVSRCAWWWRATSATARPPAHACSTWPSTTP